MARSLLLAFRCGAWLCVACQGELVNLGSTDIELGGGSGGSVAGAAPTGVWDVSSEPLLQQQEGMLLASPTLTDGGELFFSSQQRGSQGPDELSPGAPHPVRVARAAPSASGFSEAIFLSFADGDPRDVASPAVSADGTELWFGSHVPGNQTEIFHSFVRGAVLSPPELVGELSSSADDAPRPPALGGTLLPISSKRHGGLLYQIYFAQRPNPSAPWSAPSQEQLRAVNAPGTQTADGFVTESGLELYFSSTRARSSDLYVSRRSSLRAEFGAPEPLADFNTESEERMPWLSSDGQRLYFVSNRATKQYEQYALYVARKL